MPSDLAAAHANMLPQRRRHACSTRRLKGGVSNRALALANSLRNDTVSGDHRPPTSPGPAAGTHELGARDFLPPPHDQRHSIDVGCVSLAEPSRCKAETKVVSKASCAPPNNGRPSVTTSRWRPSWTSGALKSKSLTIHNPASPTLQLQRALRDGGQVRRLDGHIDKYERREGQVEAAQKQHPKQVLSDKRSCWEWLREPIQLLDRSKTSTWPSHCPPIWA